MHRQFCICGYVYEDNSEDSCPICHNIIKLSFGDDEFTPLTRSRNKRQKKHESDCECTVCEAYGTHLRELDFDNLV